MFFRAFSKIHSVIGVPENYSIYYGTRENEKKLFVNLLLEHTYCQDPADPDRNGMRLRHRKNNADPALQQ
jgi:hypothetical protein